RKKEEKLKARAERKASGGAEPGDESAMDEDSGAVGDSAPGADAAAGAAGAGGTAGTAGDGGH
ncbi:MAG: hypothetical protein RL014_2700, partial [Pseudomonadota bacterium]